jgi:hypothetical protein
MSHRQSMLLVVAPIRNAHPDSPISGTKPLAASLIVIVFFWRSFLYGKKVMIRIKELQHLGYYMFQMECNSLYSAPPAYLLFILYTRQLAHSLNSAQKFSLRDPPDTTVAAVTIVGDPRRRHCLDITRIRAQRVD